MIAFAVLSILLIFPVGNYWIGYPIFAFMTGDGRFDDFFSSYQLASRLPDATQSYVISPLLIAVYRFLSPEYSRWHFGIFQFLSFLLLLVAMVRLRGRPVHYAVLLAAYPLFFAVSRSNAELLVAALVILASSNLVRGGDARAFVGIILVAASIKPLAAVFLICAPIRDLVRSHWLLAGAVFVNGSAILGIRQPIEEFVENYAGMLESYRAAYVIGSGGSLFNNSLLGLARTTWIILERPTESGLQNLFRTVLPWLDVITILLGAMMVLTAASDSRIFIRILICSVCIVMLPSVSADYRLLYLLAPVILLLTQPRERLGLISSEYRFLLPLLLGILLPKHFVQFVPPGYPEVVTIQSVINPLLLLVIVGSVFSERLPRSFRAHIQNTVDTVGPAAKFAVVGALVTLFDYAAFNCLVYGFDASPVFSNVLSYSAAGVLSFELNRRWSFSAHQRNSPLSRQVGRYFVTVSSGMLISTSIVWVLADLVPAYAAKAISTGATFLWSFTWARIWVWEK